MSEDYFLAHCISADFGMHAGIVVEFNKRFDMKNRITKENPGYLEKCEKENMLGDCIQIDRVMNLITKPYCSGYPTYESVAEALNKMGKICYEKGIQKVAMPAIGYGIDKLEWDRVSELIQNVLKHTPIDIIVCLR